MIGILEIIFSIIAFSLIWFFIFKLIFLVSRNKSNKVMIERIQNQDIKTDLIDLVKNIPINEPKLKEHKPNYFNNIIKNIRGKFKKNDTRK